MKNLNGDEPRSGPHRVPEKVTCRGILLPPTRRASFSDKRVVQQHKVDKVKPRTARTLERRALRVDIRGPSRRLA